MGLIRRAVYFILVQNMHAGCASNHLLSFVNPSRCLLPIVHYSPLTKPRHAPSIVLVDRFSPCRYLSPLIFPSLLFPITLPGSSVYDPRDDLVSSVATVMHIVQSTLLLLDG